MPRPSAIPDLIWASKEPAQQRRLDQDAGQAEPAKRLQMDLVERGREVVTHGAGPELAEAVGMRVGELASVAKRRERRAQLLSLGEPRPLAVQAREQSLDARVPPGRLKRHGDLDQRRRLRQPESAERLAAVHLGDLLPEIEGQD